MRCRIGEINIICTDLDRSLCFYCGLLGFEARQQEGPGWHLACDGARLLLLAVATTGREPTPYCQMAEFSLDVLVEDLDAARRDCEQAGVRFVTGFPATAERFFIHDPDGLVVEIIRSKTGQE